jgi:hypothetical protein
MTHSFRVRKVTPVHLRNKLLLLLSSDLGCKLSPSSISTVCYVLPVHLPLTVCQVGQWGVSVLCSSSSQHCITMPTSFISEHHKKGKYSTVRFRETTSTYLLLHKLLELFCCCQSLTVPNRKLNVSWRCGSSG